MGKHYYCVICGETVFPDQNICPHCKNYITPKESIHDSEYYRNKSMQLIGSYYYWHQVLIDEEISQNPQYNPNTTVHNAEKAYEAKKELISQTQLSERIMSEMIGKSKRECRKILRKYRR